MNRKTLTITLGLVLFGCFFLPYMGSGFAKVSGYDAVFKYAAGSFERYLWLLIPVAAVLLVLGAAGGNYFLGRNTLVWIPLLTQLFILIRLKMETNEGRVEGWERRGEGGGRERRAAFLLVFYPPNS